MTKKPKRELVITGYDSTEMIYERRLPLHVMTDRQIGETLKRLAATHLTPDEVVFSSLRKQSRGRLDHLRVDRMSPHRFGLTTAGNPYYTATTEEVDDA